MTELMEPTRTRRHPRAARSRLRVVSDPGHDRPPSRRRRVPRPPRASGQPQAWRRRAVAPDRRTSLRRRIVPALAIAMIVMAYVYATVPFTFAGAVECRPSGIAGATAAADTPAGTIVGDADKRCAEASGSRVATAGVTAVLAAVVGVAGAVAPSRAELEQRIPSPAVTTAASVDA